MSFFDTYGNNGDIVSQVLSDVLLIQSALSEKVRLALIYCIYSFICKCNFFADDISTQMSHTMCLLTIDDTGWELYS